MPVAALAAPGHGALVWQLASPLTFAELPIIIWLAVWGVQAPPADAHAALP